MEYPLKFISLLRCQPLEYVMESFGHYPAFIRGTKYYYRCPFHGDSNPSLVIDSEHSDYGPVRRFKCQGCGVKGSGTLELVAHFLHKPADSQEVIAHTAALFGFSTQTEGEEKGDFTRQTGATPQAAYSFEYKETFSDFDLEALGCRRKLVCTTRYDEHGEPERHPLLTADGKPRYAWSWGDGFYDEDFTRYEEDPEYVNFDRSEITRVFSLRAVQSFVTPAAPDSKGVQRSWRISATDRYPIFNFSYDRDTWGKKYEPYHQGNQRGAKFVFWYAEGTLHGGRGQQVYGDIDVINYLHTGEIRDTRIRKFRNTDTESYTGMDDEVPASGKFRSLVICSGPRDALSIYFHADTHVVWFNSEKFDLQRPLYWKLRACCEQMYVCYDIDRTGIEEADRMAMKHLGLRVIRLPKALAELTDRRTGKPAKDAENFFNLYRPGNSNERFRYYGNVEDMFAILMRNATHMQFFAECWHERKKKDGGKEGYYKYEISGNSAIRLASALHLHRFRVTEDKLTYVRCEDNIVDVIPDKDIVKSVRGELKGFVATLPSVRSADRLSDAITRSNNLDRGTCEQLDEIDLDVHAWDADTEYFPFANCVVRVKADSITRLSYRNAPYQFFRQGIIQRAFGNPAQPTFRIVRNVGALEAKRREIDALITKGMGDIEREVLENRYLEYARLWEWKLEWLVPYDEQPIAVRFVYETGRIYWEKEKKGITLTAEEQQEQDLHFIVKCNAFGYLLSRHRDPARAYIVQWTDYTSMAGGKASGRTGKSALAKLINCLRSTITVPGKEMKTGENFARNFVRFRVGVHSNVLIDDLRLDIDEQQFYNLNTDMTIKTLYEDEVTLDSSECPKVQITSNRMPKMNVVSTEGRFLLCPVGGPIGFHKVGGQTVEVGIDSFFGVNIPNGLDDTEYTLCQNFLMWCLQFYLQHKSIIRPCMGREGLASMAAIQVGNRDFTEWMNEYFADGSRFGKPLSRRDMFLDWCEYIGKPITTVGQAMEMRRFKKNIEEYCNAFHYVLMPNVCYERGNSQTDRENGTIRLSLWMLMRNPRTGSHIEPLQWEWVQKERCIYIYKSNADVPTSPDQLYRPDPKKMPPIPSEQMPVEE